MKQRALFLDRDGTLVHAFHYPSRPEHLRLYDNIGPELYALQNSGFRLIVITNQSGIARGYFSEEDLQRMHAHLAADLAAQGVHITAFYACPHHPDGIIPEFAVECACRKPQPGLLRQAADEQNLDLRTSWFVGDILNDVEAGNRVGCHTILVDLATEQLPATFLRNPTFVARDTCHALRIIRTVEALQAELDLTYYPSSWNLATDDCDTFTDNSVKRLYAKAEKYV